MFSFFNCILHCNSHKQAVWNFVSHRVFRRLNRPRGYKIFLPCSAKLNANKYKNIKNFSFFSGSDKPRMLFFLAPRSALGSASDLRARGPGFDTRSVHILSFLLPLIQEGQLSVTGESMCTQ